MVDEQRPGQNDDGDRPADPTDQPAEETPDTPDAQAASDAGSRELERLRVRDRRSRSADADQTVFDQAEQLFSGGDQPCEGDGTPEMLAAVYVKPGSYQAALQALHAGRAVVLTGRPSTGKQAMARHLLLHALHVEDIEEIDPFIEPTSLLERPFVGARGYLIDNYAAERVKRLRGYHLRTLKDALQPNSYLVLTVADPSALRDQETSQVVACDLPDPVEVFLRHLQWCLRLRRELRAEELVCLRDEPVRSYLAKDERPFRGARLARQLAANPGDDLCGRLAAVLAELDDPARQAASCLEESSGDYRHWSYVLSLAVLNRQDRHLVADAADRLARRLRPPKPEDDSSWTPGPPLQSRLGSARAEEFEDQEADLDLGAVPVQRVRFQDSAMPRAVLDYVWTGYDELREPLCDWLEELAEDDDARLRRGAAVAVGYLSKHGFRWILDRLLVPWARDGWAKREAAASALEARAAEGQFTGQVLALLHSWVSSHDPELQRTAALAYGGLVGPDPSAALRDLRQVAKDDGHLAVEVAESIADLVWFQGGAKILPALEEWTGDQPNGYLAHTGRLAFLSAANLFEEPGHPRVGEWPVLLKQAEDDDALRSVTATLWRRVLAHPDYRTLAGAVLCRWTRAADDEIALAGRESPRLAPLLERVLALVASGGSADAGRLRFALDEHCAHDRDNPSQTAKKIADGIHQRGSDVNGHL